MEAIVAVLRPRHPSVATSGDFRLDCYDILLVEMRALSARDKVRMVKQLPATNILLDDEPGDALGSFLFRFTGGENGGIRGKRVVFVPASTVEPDRDSSIKGSLFCLSLDSKDMLDPVYADSLPSKPAFYCLSEVLDALHTNSVPYHKQTRVMLLRLHSWLKEKHSVPGAISVLFSSSSRSRLKQSITSPAYIDNYRSDNSSDSATFKSIANEALAHMLARNKCDVTKINPLFGSSDLNFKCRVDKAVVNRYWGLGAPDYSKLLKVATLPPPPSSPTLPSTPTQQRPSFITDTADRPVRVHSSKLDDYPLHNCAAQGDADGIRLLLNRGWSVTQKDADSYTPIHYAARHGHIKAVTVLLNEGNCSPNVINDSGSTPLHLAAQHGRVYVVELLLTHQDLDVSALDKSDRTALDLCESNEGADWQSAANLLRFAMSRPMPAIQVYLMDGSSRQLSLVSKANTTVQQLQLQMMKVLGLPENFGHLFTIWICSRNLQLQLKPEHKPIQHLRNWKSRIVVMFTDQDPVKEDPQLFWRRDAILSIESEKRVKDPTAINLLFLEAYHNYIKCLYPCANTDATLLAGILMQINNGDYDPNKPTATIMNERLLQGMVPSSLLTIKNYNWPKSIVDQYKHYSNNLASRDRSLKILQLHFLSVCWNLTAYGSAFFTGYVRKSNRVLMPVYVGVNDIGLHIITVDTKSMWKSFAYKDIEWLLNRTEDRPTLEVKTKGSNRQPAIIFTKQAGLIDHLMNKLAQLNTEDFA